MKFCAHCGRELVDEAVVCPGCGCACNNSAIGNDKWNGLAIAGFVVSFFAATVGLILSIIGYRQCKKTNEKGRSLALAGIIISSVELGIYVLTFLIYFFVIFIIYAGFGYSTLLPLL